MTKQTRDEMLRVIAELTDEFPELRFGQLIVTLSYFVKGPSHGATWDVEDEELLAAARKFLADQRSKEPRDRAVQTTSANLSSA